MAASGQKRFRSVAAGISIGRMSADHHEPMQNERQTPRADGVEIWARRIGRALGWAVAALLVIQLLRTYAS